MYIYMYIYIHIQALECGVVISSTMPWLSASVTKQKGGRVIDNKYQVMVY